MRHRAELYGQVRLARCQCGRLTRARCRACAEPLCFDVEGCQLPHRLAQRQRKICPAKVQALAAPGG